MYKFLLLFISMKFKEYIETHRVFTTNQLVAALDFPSSAQILLNRALKSGDVERIRRGSYASKVGMSIGAVVDKFEVVASIDSKAILSFHSALEAHGIAHNVTNTCQFRTKTIKAPFSYAGIDYMPYRSEEGVLTKTFRSTNGARILATSREQTIIDCLDHPERSGGIEETLRSLSLFPYTDVDVLISLLKDKTASLAARVGWLLEEKADDWHLDEDTLASIEALAVGGPFRLDKHADAAQGWSKKWNLCLPENPEETASWTH